LCSFFHIPKTLKVSKLVTLMEKTYTLDYCCNSDINMTQSGTSFFFSQVPGNTGECTTPDGEIGSCRSLPTCVQAEFVDDYETFLKYFCSIGR
jgi:hypothetical protein